ncbi:MAG: single-stranded DNA-binding protein [Oscillospiraceae bacterium]
MFNKVILIGRLTADPELKQTPNGAFVTSFAVAADRSFTPKNGERQTDFIDCVAWQNTAEFIAKYFAKGKVIGIDGSLQTRNYEDKSGNKRKAVEVLVSNAFFTESKGSSGGETPTVTAVVANRSGTPTVTAVTPPSLREAVAAKLPPTQAESLDFAEMPYEDDLPF